MKHVALILAILCVSVAALGQHATSPPVAAEERMAQSELCERRILPEPGFELTGFAFLVTEGET